jgi:hypothetical protein
MVPGVVITRPHLAQAILRLALAAAEHSGRQPTSFLIVELDQSGDRPRAALDVGELALEPIRRRARIGVGAGDQAVRPPEAEQLLTGGIHADPARCSGAGARTVEHRDRQAELAGCVGDDLRGVVDTVVEHDDRREAVARECLGRQGAQAIADSRALVPRWDDDDRR